MESNLSQDGLRNWQTILVSSEAELGSTPTSSFNVASEMNRDIQLKAAMIGPGSIVLTACKLPPCPKTVTRWLKAKQEYQKHKHLEKESKVEQKLALPKFHDTSKPGSSEIDISKIGEKKGKGKLPMTGKGTVKSSKNTRQKGKGSISKPKDHPSDDYEIDEASPDDSGMELDLDDSDLDKSSFNEDIVPVSPEVGKRRSLIPRGHFISAGKTPSSLVKKAAGTMESPSFLSPPLPKRRRRSVEGPVEHSTPAKHSPGVELTLPAYTPIRETSQGRDLTTPTSSRTRGPLRLQRRESTGSDASLRRVLLSTQLKNQFSTPAILRGDTSQIEGPSMRNSFGFKVSMQCVQDAKALHEFQYLTTLSIELHIRTRGDLRPDPEFDAICGLFYHINSDIPPDKGQRDITGVIILDTKSVLQPNRASPRTGPSSSKKRTDKIHQPLLEKSGITGLEVAYVADELELIKSFVDLVKRWDPDFLVGYEIQMLSWGYLLQRAAHLSVELSSQLARVSDGAKPSHFSAEKDEYGSDHMSEINIAGRIVLNLWRVLRHELTLNVYSFENVIYHVLHRRIPLLSFRKLTSWWDHRTHLNRWRTVEYYVTRVRGNVQIMEQLDMVGQTSELARVFGIEFYHVLSRGSQYRVESMMLRIAKPMNFIPVSPSVQQRARMKAPECIPLTLEPESRFYTDPVVVVDFQSLYPSIMIGYNYCYSTCLGRLDHLQNAQEGAFDFGCTSLTVPPATLKMLKDDITVCPNGVAFVRQHVKKGILPRMVEEILKTRIMVKKSMQKYKGDKTLERLLHARQLGLKLIANVTFGYTSANYSGRMPCCEIGDSIVRKARETLERAIQLVEDTPKWGAKVVYGDTDSMFIVLKGRSKDEAFRIGQEIADAVTADNPKPVKLKFEKVYLPCVLQTKKRYVGFMYETPDQKEPVYDAKGIETVRRDSCPAVAKILERSIKILFTMKDVSEVKRYVQRQCQKLLEGRASVQDCIFAKEYRGMSGYKPGATVPALEIAKKLLSRDRRAEPRVGERVPYVIVYGTPGLPLIQLVRLPHEILNDASLRLNATYYITKQVLPPLDRMFSLLGVDVRVWYNDLPRVVRTVPILQQTTEGKKGTISQYFSTLHCPVCEELTREGLCATCRQDPQGVVTVLNSRIQTWERTQHTLAQVCYSCMGVQDPDLSCLSLDCPVLFRLSRATRDAAQADGLRQLLDKSF